MPKVTGDVNSLLHIVFFLPLNRTISSSPFEPEILHFPLMASTLSLCLLTLLPLVSSQSDLPETLFINCGSNSNINFNDRNFVGDARYSHGGHAAIANLSPASNTPPIYHTARVFTKKSWYELQAKENHTFVLVRLHFFSFSTKKYKLSDSKFEVSVSGFSLLSNFSVRETIEIREIIIPTGTKQSYRIEFTPSIGSSHAFVNAIEAFTTPSNLFTDVVSFPLISPAGIIGKQLNLTSTYAFNPIYRINVGGQTIDRERDILKRTWTPDDSFIVNSELAINKSSDGRINHIDGRASSLHAPDDVYKTAKQLKNNSFNITWNFGVNNNAKYLVRAHFCDFLSQALSDDAFNFYIYRGYNQTIAPSDTTIKLAAAFFVDLVVDFVESGFVNITISAKPGKSSTVFLNGLEIMELLTNSGAVDQKDDRHNTNTTAYMVVGSCVALVLISVASFFLGSKYGKKANLSPRSHSLLSFGGGSFTGLNIDPSRNPHSSLNLRIPFGDIMKATNSFDENLVIGRGGFGKVYKGTLSNGRKVAVKRGEKGHGQGRPEFVTEIMVLSRIRHRHLVSLIGYCDAESEMILVYEFMEKGTLQDHLYDNKDHPKLSWERRLEICISAARGLHYLHTGLKDAIIHCDVKSTNILLNDRYVAKVADFGISRFDNVEESEILNIKGSFGYMDPEYTLYMIVTQKSDVYSFGVVLLEVLCARPALDHKLPPNEVNLADWAIKQIKDGNTETIIDPFLVGMINKDSLRIFLKLVEGCLKDKGDERPSMIQVQMDLEYALACQQTVVDKDEFEDSTINTSLQLSKSTIHRLPFYINDDSEVNDSSSSNYPSESQVFSQLRMDEAR